MSRLKEDILVYVFENLKAYNSVRTLSKPSPKDVTEEIQAF